MTREQLSEFDRSYANSMTQPNAEEGLTHAFNYVLPVYDETGENVVFRNWYLDSGDHECLVVNGYSCVFPDQIKWFRDANSEIPMDDPSKGKGFLWVHIPFNEFLNVVNDYDYYGQKNSPLSCWAVDTGMFAAMKEQPTVNWVSCGHDHCTDLYGEYYGIFLGFGRKTGYGSYGPAPGFITRGARVFEMTKDPWNIDTWVREEDGTVVRYNR